MSFDLSKWLCFVCLAGEIVTVEDVQLVETLDMAKKQVQ